MTALLMLATGLDRTGGIQESARLAWQGLARDLGRDGCSPSLVSFGPVEPACAANAAAAPVYAARTRPGLALTVLSRRWDADAVLLWHLGLARLLPWMRGCRHDVIAFLHGIEAWRPWPPRVLGRVHRFLCNSDFTWQAFTAHNPACASRPHEVVWLGTGEPAGPVRPPDPEPTALMLARLSRAEDYKGHREVLAAWPQVLERRPDARLWIAGDGDLRPDLEQAAAGLGDCVRFFGRVSEEVKQDLLARCHALVMPSRGEGFGLVYLEAMRLGRPCLVSTCDAGREVVNPPEAGLAADSADPDALAAALVDLLSSGPVWDAWSAAARRRYEAHFTAAHFQHRLGQALLAPAPAPPAH